MKTFNLWHVLRLIWSRLVVEIVYLPTRLRALRLNASVPIAYYEQIGEIELRQRVRGDTLFILGSGSSLAMLPSEIQEEMKLNSTMSLNYSILQSFIRADYHVVRELGVANDVAANIQSSDLKDFGELIARNSCYSDTNFLVQGGYYAWAANSLIGHRGLPRGTRVFRYRNTVTPGFGKLGSSFSTIRHGASTITDCINIGYLLGFKNIVLCGVDLYDRRYFWHVPSASFISLPGVTDASIGEYGGVGDLTAKHRAAGRLIGQISAWREELAAAGVNLSVQNPESLLTEVLPVHRASQSYS